MWVITANRREFLDLVLGERRHPHLLRLSRVSSHFIGLPGRMNSPSFGGKTRWKRLGAATGSHRHAA